MRKARAIYLLTLVGLQLLTQPSGLASNEESSIDANTELSPDAAIDTDSDTRADPALFSPDGEYSKRSWPVSWPKRPLLLASEMLELTGQARIDLSKGAAGKRLLLAPGFRYGLFDPLNIEVTHDQGLCIGTKTRCPVRYGGLVSELSYAIVRLPRGLEILLSAGLGLDAVDPVSASTLFGVKVRAPVGRHAIVSTPLVRVRLNNREARLAETFSIPIELRIAFTEKWAGSVESGIGGSFSELKNDYVVPAGISIRVTPSREWDLGARFRFDNLAGKGGSADGRTLELLFSLRR